jgi:TPR repeat protein
MRRILATLAVIALLFSAGSAWADDTSEANKLFVEAMQLWLSAEDEESLEKKAVALEASLAKLNKIFDEHPSTELAVKLISGQDIGDISLRDVAKAAKRARWNADARAEFEMALKLAEQGDADAQSKLGNLYQEGTGVPQNYTEALKWFRKAVEQGNAEGQFNLGVMYAMGEGVPENKAEAVKWWRKAAGQGHERAKQYLEWYDPK